MKEKNTQNAVVPTKDTRQYKHTPKTPKRLISRIFALVALVMLLAIFTITSFADASTLSPRKLMIPEIPLQSMGFYKTANGIRSTIASPFSLYSVDGGILTDITRYPTEISSSGTSVTGLVSYNWRHYMEVGADATYKKVNTEFYSYATWSSLFSSRGAGTFEAVSLEFQPFKNLQDPDAYFRIVSSSTHIIPPPRLRIYYQYTRYGEVIQGYTERGNAYVSPLQDPNSGDYVYTVFICDYLPDEANELITNYRISIDVEYNSGQTGYISGVEGVYYHNTFVDKEVFEQRLSNLPVGKPVQVVNSRNFSDLLDWLGDVLAGFLSTPLFSVGTLSVSIGTIIATIFGVLFVFLFLRFFSGG